MVFILGPLFLIIQSNAGWSLKNIIKIALLKKFPNKKTRLEVFGISRIWSGDWTYTLVLKTHINLKTYKKFIKMFISCVDGLTTLTCKDQKRANVAAFMQKCMSNPDFAFVQVIELMI